MFLTLKTEVVLICLFALANLTFADEPPAVTKDLFDGKTLSGWHVERCEAEVVDGTILLKAGNGLVRTDQRYGDFILDLEWLALRKEGRWDSGIYFRCELPDPKGKRPWPSRYQVNLLRGQEGNLGGFKDATSTGLVKDGEWNRFQLTAIGSQVSLKINGKHAWKTDGLEADDGYIGLQAEVPGGGMFRFRNIKLTKLD